MTRFWVAQRERNAAVTSKLRASGMTGFDFVAAMVAKHLSEGDQAAEALWRKCQAR
jgi:hypothetical protein